MMPCLWWAPSMKRWNWGGYAIIPLTLKHRCHERIAALQKGLRLRTADTFGNIEKHDLTVSAPFLPHQRCLYVDQSACGGGGAQWLGAGGFGPGAPRHQRSPGRTPSYCWGGGHRGPGGYSHQLQGGEAEDAPAWLIPGWPTRPHLCGL